MIRDEAEIREKLAQHEENLDLWVSGYLAPTEPDDQERRLVRERLRAAISTLKWVLGEEVS